MKIRASTLRLPLLFMLIAAWEVSARLNLIDPNWFTPPTLIVSRLAQEIVTGRMLEHTGITLFETLLGFLVGLAGGVVFGLLLAFLHRTREVLMPYLVAIYGIPRPALAPLFVIWFGIGIVSKVMLIVSLVYFVVLIYVLDGIRHINPTLLRFASTTGASSTQVLLKITLPSLLSWISASMKLSMSLAIIGAVVGEVVAANAGLGYYILRASYQSDTAGVYVGLTVLAIIGWVLVYAMERLDRRLFHWQREIVL
jgi:NitT/TauT family transport system permease protein